MHCVSFFFMEEIGRWDPERHTDTWELSGRKKQNYVLLCVDALPFYTRACLLASRGGAKHSKNNCAGSVFTAAERNKDKGSEGYGTVRQRLGELLSSDFTSTILE